MIKENFVVLCLGFRQIIALKGEVKGEVRLLDYKVFKDPAGFQNGLVSNLEKASQTIENVISDLLAETDGQSILQRKAISVYVVLGNAKVKSYTYSSSKYFQAARRNVSSHDIQEVIDQTRSVATLPLSEFILQVIPVSFTVNDLNGVVDPIGLEAERLGVTLKIFTMEFESFRNILKVFELAEIDVKGYFPRTLTASQAILTKQEKHDGALLIDIGDEATFLTYWRKGELVHSHLINIGTIYLAQQISKEWQIELDDADKVLRSYGSMSQIIDFGDELIPLIVRNGQNGLPIQRQDFHRKYLELTEEWLGLVLREAENFSREERFFHPRYVFTGEGACFDGFLEFLQNKFQLYARLGHSHQIHASHELLVNPSMTAALGMLSWMGSEEASRTELAKRRGVIQKTLQGAKNWFSTYF